MTREEMDFRLMKLEECIRVQDRSRFILDPSDIMALAHALGRRHTIYLTREALGELLGQTGHDPVVQPGYAPAWAKPL